MLTFVFFQVPAQRATMNQRPNIIVIMVDDMGFSDIGSYGSEINTPNLDRLAFQGVRFSQFYNAGRCCPSRAALLTGLYSHQAGIGHMIDEYTAPIRQKLNSPAYTDHLSERCRTIAERLKESGYQTFMTGKWHVGKSTPPEKRGFDRSYALINGACNYFDPTFDPGVGMVKTTITEDGHPQKTFDEGYYTTDVFTDKAISFIKSAESDRPYFLYLAYNAPHWPLHAPSEDIAKYTGKYLIGWHSIRDRRFKKLKQLGVLRPQDQIALTARDSRIPEWDDIGAKDSWRSGVIDVAQHANVLTWEKVTDKNHWDRRMAVYAAQIDRVDQNIGKLISLLDGRGELENTLIIFLSDNGAADEHPYRGEQDAPIGSRQSYMAYGTGWANTSNTPFRQYKVTQHEGGIATPLVMHWPARTLNRGYIDHAPGHIIDIAPTCFEAAGIKMPNDKNGGVQIEGKSLLEALRGRRRELHQFIGWEHQGNRAVRNGKWKLVSLHKGKWELYNLSRDRTELDNLAHRKPGKVKSMEKAWQQWADKVGAKPWPGK